MPSLIRTAVISSIAAMTWAQEPPSGGGGVDALFEHDQVDAALVEMGGEFGHLPYRPERPRQAGGHEFVAAA